MILCSLWFGSPCGGEESSSFTVVVLGQEQGTLEPCGCTPGMLGGIPRRATALAQIRETHLNTFVLHNGELIKSFGAQAQLKRDTQIEALNRAEISALGVGSGDWVLGAGALVAAQKQARFPLVASNLEDSRGQLTFPPKWETTIPLTPQPVTLKVFSWISTTLQPELDRVVPGLRLRPLDQLKELVKEKKENEFWVLLFHGQPQEPQALATQMPQWNLIVWNHEGEVPYQQQFGPTLLVSTGAKNHYFMSFTFNGAAPFAHKKAERIMLDKKYADDPDVQALLAEYKTKVKEEQLAEKYPRVSRPDGAVYAGSESCATCHQAQFAAWKNSKHSHAQEKLIEKKDAWDPDCLQCHSVGFKFQGGFVSREKTAEFANVGCESCHGPRSLHVKTPLENKGKPATQLSCLQCHDAENSPNFNFETYWPKIEH